MATIRRFLFDRSFDDPDRPAPPPGPDAAAALAFAEPPPEPEPEPEPTFSLQELESARADAFETGRAQGIAEAAATAESLIAQALSGVLGRIDDLFAIQSEVNDRIARDAATLAITAVRKLFPAYTRRHGAGEAEAIVAAALERLESEPRVTVRVNAALAEALGARLMAAASARGHEERLQVTAAADVAPGDCVVQWTNGGAERVADDIWREIDAIVDRALGGPEADAGPLSPTSQP